MDGLVYLLFAFNNNVAMDTTIVDQKLSIVLDPHDQRDVRNLSATWVTN